METTVCTGVDDYTAICLLNLFKHDIRVDVSIYA